MSLPLPDSFNALLTESECTQIDQTLLPTRDRFNIRLKLYSARYLSRLATNLDVPIVQLTHQQIINQLQADPNLQDNGQPEENFIEWFGNLLDSSIRALVQISDELGVDIERLTLEQLIDWHRQQCNLAEI